MIIDRMKISRTTRTDIPDYGSLFLIKETKNGINEYGGTDIEDASKLTLITNAALGSTCLFTNGSLYRKELNGWNQMGESTSTEEEQTPIDTTPVETDQNA